MRSRKLLFGALFVTFFLFCFQSIAFFARKYFVSGAVCNEYGPFGVMLSPGVLGGIFFLASIFFLSAWWKEKKRTLEMIWLLLVTAGVSNILERVRYGCVFDFLDLPLLPLFNVADVVLTLGVVFLVWWEIQGNGS